MAEEKNDRKEPTVAERGRECAERVLAHMGYEVLERDWECPAGTVDIIALDGDTLVFCQVRVRTNFEKGFPTGTFTQEQRARFEKAACWYLHKHDEHIDMAVRADEMVVMVVGENRAMVRHYVNQGSQTL